MRWPWQKPEVRQQSSYTDTLIQTIVQQASGQPIATPLATAALEAASGAVGRAFAGAAPQGPPDVITSLTPSNLGLIGRQLIRSGEAVLYIEVQDGQVQLQPAADWDVGGQSPDPATWTYRLNLATPDRYRTLVGVSALQVLHCRYMTEPATPWRGVSPLEAASQSGRLSAELTKALADEASGPRGSYMPTPKPADDPTVAPLVSSTKRANGAMLFVETMMSEFRSGTPQASPSDWTQKRFGADPPSSLIALQQLISSEVYAACGCSGLFQAADSAGQREAFRRFLHGTVAPIAAGVQAELTAKLDTDITLNFDGLFAADLAGRARAFGSMVQSGLDITQAAQLSGLVAGE